MTDIPLSPSSPAAKQPNRLAQEKSPYLLQHAHNPVDWYPWGEEAFEKAARENKPVFLSIGYSTCHWCHVMEKESFEDENVAMLLNRSFVSIKVDREERPDVDGIYMTACQMLTGSGGWPLTIIMTADKQPFFAGTYFPRESRFGRIGMLDLLPRVETMWEHDRVKIGKLAAEITEQLGQDNEPHPSDPVETVFDEAFAQLTQLFDKDSGGFSSAPKFPTAHILLFLLRYEERTGDGEALRMVTGTLDAMRNGGIYDHVGFGFHRYATDSRWLVPHFEKMLYDQAMLCLAYTEAFQVTGNHRYKKTAEEIIAYVLRDMTSPAGGFLCAEDADSEGEEGKFYVWSYDEIIRIFDREAQEFICNSFDIRKQGNFIDPVTGERPGTNILHQETPLPVLAAAQNLSVQQAEARIEEIRARLFAVRETRVHPHKDDKILTDWNGLMITALARAAKAFQQQAYAAAAAHAADFLLERLRNPDGSLLHRYRQDDAALPAHIDDYAFLISGLLELYEATLESQHLHRALSLNDILIRHYWDHDAGGFFFTADNGEDLLVRKKEVYDSSIPSGNSVALMNLLRLARMTGDNSLEDLAVRSARSFFSSVRQAPSAHAYFLCALDYYFGPAYKVVIAGRPGSADAQEMLRTLQTSFLPHVTVQFRPHDDSASGISDRATAYVCRDYHCLPPTTDPEAMLALLRAPRQT